MRRTRDRSAQEIASYATRIVSKETRLDINRGLFADLVEMLAKEAIAAIVAELKQPGQELPVDCACTFVSENIQSILGYAQREMREDPDF